MIHHCRKQRMLAHFLKREYQLTFQETNHKKLKVENVIEMFDKRTAEGTKTAVNRLVSVLEIHTWFISAAIHKTSENRGDNADREYHFNIRLPAEQREESMVTYHVRVEKADSGWTIYDVTFVDRGNRAAGTQRHAPPGWVAPGA